MKKIFMVMFLFLVVGCSTSNVFDNSIKQSDIKGYWLQIEENWSGDITDLSNNPYAYLEITDNRLFFYSISLNEDEGYSLSEKYYKLEKAKLYYDYYELKGNDWKENIDESFGGTFQVTINGDKLILLQYNNNKNEDDGYKKNTYKKIGSKDWPIKE